MCAFNLSGIVVFQISSASEMSDSEHTHYSDDDYIPDFNDSSSDETIGEPQVKKPRKLFTEDTVGTSEVITGNQQSTIIVSPTSRSSTVRSRAYDKKQYCLFCCKPYSKMARHLETVHCNEVEVVKAVMFPKNSTERRNGLNHLRKRGIFAHNADVVRQGGGHMIPCYRPKQSTEAVDFIHCIHCQGLYSKKSLWRHVRICPLKKKDGEPKGGRKCV